LTEWLDHVLNDTVETLMEDHPDEQPVILVLRFSFFSSEDILFGFRPAL